MQLLSLISEHCGHLLLWRCCLSIVVASYSEFRPSPAPTASGTCMVASLLSTWTQRSPCSWWPGTEGAGQQKVEFVPCSKRTQTLRLFKTKFNWGAWHVLVTVVGLEYKKCMGILGRTISLHPCLWTHSKTHLTWTTSESEHLQTYFGFIIACLSLSPCACLQGCPGDWEPKIRWALSSELLGYVPKVVPFWLRTLLVFFIRQGDSLHHTKYTRKKKILASASCLGSPVIGEDFLFQKVMRIFQRSCLCSLVGLL